MIDREITARMDVVFNSHRKEPKGESGEYHPWELEIFARIREGIDPNDEEALALFDYTLAYAQMKSNVAG